MQKIRNRKEDVISESFEGLTLAYEKYWIRHPEVKGIISRTRRKDKVSLVIGGGSGHEPLYSCFVGPGLADAAVCGNIFASPDPNTIVKTAECTNNGRGILFVYGCYAGDNMNFDMADLLASGGHDRVWNGSSRGKGRKTGPDGKRRQALRHHDAGDF